MEGWGEREGRAVWRVRVLVERGCERVGWLLLSLGCRCVWRLWVEEWLRADCGAEWLPVRVLLVGLCVHVSVCMCLCE